MLGSALPFDIVWLPECRRIACADGIPVLAIGTPPFPVVDVNEAWLRACGMQRDDVVGKTMKVIQGPLTEMDRVQRLMVRAMYSTADAVVFLLCHQRLNIDLGTACLTTFAAV